MPMTVEIDAENAQAKIFIDFTTEGSGTQTFGTLYRSIGTPDGPFTAVRGLFGTQLLGEQAYVFDTEAPLDTEIYYLAQGGPDPWGIQQGPFVIPSDGSVWLKDPGRPWADMTADLCENPSTPTTLVCEPDPDQLSWVGLGTKTRRMDAGVFDVLDRERAADVYARRKDLDTSCQFLSRSLSAIDGVYDLFTVGGPLFMQLPAVYGFKDRYMQPGDLEEAYLSRDQRKPYRLWSAPLTAVEAPVGEPQGTDLSNWCAYRDTYPTFGDVPGGVSWGGVAAGDASAMPFPDGYGEGLYGEGTYGA